METEFLNIDEFPDLTSPLDVRESVDAHLIEDQVIEACRTLDVREQQALICIYWQGLSIKETGYVLGISSERTSQLWKKALRKLRHETRTCLLVFDEDLPTYRARKHKKALARTKREVERLQKQEREWRERQTYRELKLIEHRKAIEERIEIERIERDRQQEEHRKKLDAQWQDVPEFVFLGWRFGQPFLWCDPNTGYSVRRDLCPDLYDRWLEQRLKAYEKLKGCAPI